MSYVLAFIGFALLIILHEAGHFAAAKAVGMRVERFSLFFGPLLVKFRRGETEYGIGPLPLGGYVKITGMNPNEEIPPDVLPRAYYNQAVWKRVVVIMAGPAVNLLIAFGLIMAIAWSGGEPVTSHGQLQYQIDQPTFPASQYLRSGDRIRAVDGRQHLSAAQITAQIAHHPCAGAQVAGCVAKKPVRMDVLRGKQKLSFPIYPRYDAAAKRARLGFVLALQLRSIGPARAASTSVSEMWFVTRSTVSTIAKLFEPKVRSQLHGIVGGFKVTQQRFAFDTTEALYTLALISLSLAVINLFPFLPLDGGHVFWAVAEKVRGKRIPFVVMERAGALGFVLILLLFVIGLSNDISTLTGRGFGTR